MDLIAGEEATRSGLAGLQEDARDASSAIAARLDAVRKTNSTTWCPGPKAKWLERKAAAVAAVRVQEPDAGLCTMLAAACGTQ